MSWVVFKELEKQSGEIEPIARVSSWENHFISVFTFLVYEMIKIPAPQGCHRDSVILKRFVNTVHAVQGIALFYAGSQGSELTTSHSLGSSSLTLDSLSPNPGSFTC